MARHLNHAQAIIGVNTGRGTGIIDTLHLTEVALSAQMLPLEPALAAGVRDWFANYTQRLWTSANGIDGRDEINNHGTNYAVQIATFARLTGEAARLNWCREALLNQLIPAQIAPDGRQPLELSRTKPFGYCLFNLDLLATLAHRIAPGDAALWTAKTAQSGAIADALAYMAPFIADKTRWPHARDVEYWNDWPMRQPLLWPWREG